MCWHLSVSLPWWAVALLFGDSRFPFPRLPAPVRGVARRSGISLTHHATPGRGCAHAKAPRLAIRGHFGLPYLSHTSRGVGGAAAGRLTQPTATNGTLARCPAGALISAVLSRMTIRRRPGVSLRGAVARLPERHEAVPPSPGPGGYLLLHLGIRQGGFQSLNPRQRDGDHGFQILYLRRQH